jgi:predicted metal-dependent phosphoesterase TrpH
MACIVAKLGLMLQDFHLHTLVSDGDLTPADVLFQAAARHVTHLSITDHDALGAYRWEGGVVFEEAKRLGLDLTVGIEMDADMDGQEVHVLGLGVGLDDAALNEHLERVRQTRFERARREIGIVNGLLGAGTIREEDIFVPGRETLMKPHFIHPILERVDEFETYEDANAWYRKNVKSGVSVPKPKIGDVIALIKGAGGWAALAHPGYYGSGEAMAAKLGELKGLGLDGVELTYPYFSCSPRQFTADSERAFVDFVRAAAEKHGLRVTRGSDCHTADDFERVYGPAQVGA